MIKKRILQKKIDTMIKNLQQRPLQQKIIHKVAILNNPTSNLTLQNLLYLEKSLHLNSTNFEIFTIKQRKDNYNELRGVVATIDSFNTFGKIKSETINSFLNQQYDLLIDFTNQTNLVEKYFLLAIQANFRVGYQNKDEIYDMMLMVKHGEIKPFIDEMVRYLKIIGLSK